MIKIYNEEGYVDIPSIIQADYPFTIIYGGRGTGKTYGALLYALQSGRKFILMRRTAKQADKIAKPEFTPFKSVLLDHPEYKIIARKSDDIGTINKYHWNDKEEMEIEDPPIGYVCALSTIANLRGFDASDVDLFIFDEFQPELHEKIMKSENEAILNAYETCNRNRELRGQAPIQFVALANSNRIDNPLFQAFGLINIADEMSRKKRAPVYANRDRGILLIALEDSPISKRKRMTALYQATSGSNFEKMALDNEFSGFSSDNIRPADLREFNPIVTVGELTIYRHKSDRRYHAAMHRRGNPPAFTTDEISLKRFRTSYSYIWYSYIERNNITFDSASCITLFEHCFI